MKTLTEKVTALLESRVTSYKIAKKLGLMANHIDVYRNGKSSIDNMSLKRAEQLGAIYDELVEEGKLK